MRSEDFNTKEFSNSPLYCSGEMSD